MSNLCISILQDKTGKRGQKSSFKLLSNLVFGPFECDKQNCIHFYYVREANKILANKTKTIYTTFITMTVDWKNMHLGFGPNLFSPQLLCGLGL